MRPSWATEAGSRRCFWRPSALWGTSPMRSCTRWASSTNTPGWTARSTSPFSPKTSYLVNLSAIVSGDEADGTFSDPSREIVLLQQPNKKYDKQMAKVRTNGSKSVSKSTCHKYDGTAAVSAVPCRGGSWM